MEKKRKTILEEIQGTVDEIISQVKKLIKEGNARRVIIKNKKGRILFQSQLTLGAAGVTFFIIYAPFLTAITTLVLMASDITVFVERDINESDDEYEVDADVIEIQDEEEEANTDEKDKNDKTSDSDEDEKDSEK